MPGLDWPGLLAWSTKHHDGTKPSEFKQLSEEDRAFITKAYEHAMSQIADPNKIFKEAVDMMQAPEATEEAVATALEMCDRSCDDPDVARNAELLGGIQALLDAAEKRTSIGVRTRAMEILALLLQNNEPLQRAAANRNGLAILRGLVTGAPAGDAVRAKAFRALVALVRGLGDLEEAFLAQDGLAITLSCLDEKEDHKLREKALSFVTTLLLQDRNAEAVAAGAAPALVALLRDVSEESSMQFRETLASCCLALVRRVPGAGGAELSSAASARLAQLDTGDENEASSLREVVATLGA